MDNKKTWVTEVAAMLSGLGGGCIAVSQLPMVDPQIRLYALIAGTLLGSIGAPLLGYRISKKLRGKD